MKSRTKKILYLALTVIMVLFSACGGGAAPSGADSQKPADSAASDKSYVLKFALNDAAGSTYDKMVIQPLQQKLQEKSGGRLSLEVYYSSSLVQQGKVLDAIRKGTCDAGLDILTMNAGQYPYTELLGTPGLNLGDCAAFTATTNEYAKAFPEKGLEDFVVLARFSSGTFGVVSVDKPITKASDLKGLPMRATPNFIPWWNNMGASGTMIPMTDIYESLKLSVIKGAQVTLAAVDAFKMYEVTNYFTPLTMLGGDQILVLSRPLYNSMSADLQAAIDEVCKEMPSVGVKYIETAQQEAKDKINKANPKFVFVDPKDVEPQGFIDAALPLLQAKAKELDDNGFKGTEALKWLQGRVVK
jgi:TRAP-type C4-dicarboxylate transport system substrate-binding protein